MSQGVRKVRSEFRTGRVEGLDALRGLAALVVLVHHSLLVAPALAAAYLPNARRPGTASWSWWLTYTPLHLFWAGPEAVIVFFVLSGYVLALPWASGRAAGWRSYYPQRLLRLYLPVAGAVVFAWLTTLLVNRGTGHGSWWLASHRDHFSAGDLLRDAFLLHGVDTLNTALWSLRWEVLFSLLLPLYLWAFLRPRWQPVLVGVALQAVITVGYVKSPTLHYMPMFALGVLLAAHRAAVARSLDRMWRRLSVLYVAATWLCLIAVWLVAAAGLDRRSVRAAAGTVEVVGAVLLVAAIAHGRWAGLLAHPVPRWLGRRSFSLYLVHEPVVVAVAILLGSTGNPVLVLAVAGPVALLLAEGFGRLVEVPSHRLAQRVGRHLRHAA